MYRRNKTGPKTLLCCTPEKHYPVYSDNGPSKRGVIDLIETAIMQLSQRAELEESRAKREFLDG